MRWAAWYAATYRSNWSDGALTKKAETGESRRLVAGPQEGLTVSWLVTDFTPSTPLAMVTARSTFAPLSSARQRHHTAPRIDVDVQSLDRRIREERRFDPGRDRGRQACRLPCRSPSRCEVPASRSTPSSWCSGQSRLLSAARTRRRGRGA